MDIKTVREPKIKVVSNRRALRLVAGIEDVEALANRLRLKSSSTIYMIEREERDPSPELAKEICKEYGCTMDQLYSKGVNVQIRKGADGKYQIIPDQIEKIAN